MKSKDHKVEQRSAPKIMLKLQLLQHVEMFDRCKSNGQMDDNNLCLET